MIAKTFITLLCIGVAVAGFGWHRWFYMIVGLPVLFLIAWIAQVLRSRLTDENNMESEGDEDQGIGHAFVWGLLRGLVAVALLYVTFAIAKVTPILALIEGPDCHATIGELEILKQGQAYARIVEMVETTLQQPLRSDCQRTLMEWQVHSLLTLGEKTQPPLRTELWQRAEQTAKAILAPELIQLVQSKLEAETKQHIIDQQRVAMDHKDDLIAKNEDAVKALIDQLKAQHFPVKESKRGIEVILGEAALSFASGKFDLDVKAHATMRQLIPLLNWNDYAKQRILVVGHTDSHGSDHASLSLARAKSVAQALVDHGVDRSRLKVEGGGADNPVADNTTASGRAKNRRVEIIIQKG